ncbi:MAG: phosphate ABC transporter permease [Anaerolineae bacterium]|nr:MAG: phosphate ABC transporter permease [Anaerolineae bacterium]WKZ45135.1 MAG: ABC transporter permease [Anaerolineales bacterium]
MRQIISNLKILFYHRDLLFTWTYRIIRGRYQQSVLGGLWAIIVPAASTVIFSIIFTLFVPVDTGETPYLIFSYAAMVPWTLFSSSIGDMVESLTSNINLVSKIYFPREILPISALLARLVDAGISFILLIMLMLYYRVVVNPMELFYFPIILAVQCCLSLGIGFFGSALHVFYRDMRPVIILGLQLWFYASPVIYPLSAVPNSLKSLYSLNPMVGVIESFRAIMLSQQISGSVIVPAALLAVLILIFGYWFFKRAEFQFADVI